MKADFIRINLEDSAIDEWDFPNDVQRISIAGGALETFTALAKLM
jgi:hypothetical protein